jgi:integrase/recombinase XerD
VAKVAPVLWKHKTDAAGHHPIWLRFNDAHRSLYASLGVAVHPRFWNERQGRVRKGHPHADRINGLIQRRLGQAEEERLRLLTEGEPVTAEALKAAVAPSVTAGPAPCFLRYTRAYLEGVERRGNVGRFKKEGAVMNKLEEFASAPLPFERITPNFLRDYEAHLLGELKNKASTAQSNLNIIRTHYRRAVKEGVVPRESDPFLVYSPPKAQRPERHKLSDRELAAVEALDLGGSGPSAPLIARVRDAFLFALYAAGMRFADVARLECGDLREETTDEGARALRLTYTMGKTGKRASLRLVSSAERIARAYLVDAEGRPKAPNTFLFPMLEGYDLSTPRGQLNAVASQNALHNKYLSEIADRAKVSGHLSFHVARHSFADLARRRGWDVYAISKALAHGQLATTEGYLAGFDGELLDRRLSELFGGQDG